mmetsp:Transcript_14397/g.30951  ORF Transcript_14397/g.30951 Transcript_14397/m.30951 type:complete len:109 (+) Transcript_14397:1251-1577(+)|eukprot:scaffold2107_cov192-Alexandrium_tamarense.AAC.61
MCNTKPVHVEARPVNSRNSVPSLVHHQFVYRDASPSLSDSETQPASVHTTIDMFQVYSTQGVASHELEIFSVIRTRTEPSSHSKRNKRVSAEIHPLLLFEQLIMDEEI